MTRDVATDGASERSIRVEPAQLKLFAKAIGEADPVYFDPTAAAAAGLAGPLAPPTFAYSLGVSAFAAGTWSDDLGIDPSRLLHAEQGFEYFLPIHAGEEVVLKRRVVDRFDKKGGSLSFVVVETDALNQQGELCVRSRMVGVVVNS